MALTLSAVVALAPAPWVCVWAKDRPSPYNRDRTAWPPAPVHAAGADRHNWLRIAAWQTVKVRIGIDVAYYRMSTAPFISYQKFRNTITGYRYPGIREGPPN